MQQFVLKRSYRKTLSIEINKELEVVVRAPLWLSSKKINEFVEKNQKWIEKNVEKRKKINQAQLSVTYSPNEIRQMKQKVEQIILPKVEYYSQIMGVKPVSIKITSAKTRYGSCSAKNGLCFSCFLANYSEKAIDCVVVHELAHIKIKNHSKHFYALVEQYLPDYKILKKSEFKK